MTGAGRVIYNPIGDPIASFELGLGNLSNNRAEALALYQGLIQLQKLGIKNMMVFGDSTVIISLMNSKRKASNIFIQQTISKCQALICQNWDLRFFHVLRAFNKEADKCANQACNRSKRNLLCNNVEHHHHLP